MFWPQAGQAGKPQVPDRDRRCLFTSPVQVCLSVGPISPGIWSRLPQLRSLRGRTLPLCVVGGWTLGALCHRGSPTPPEQGGLQQELPPGSHAAFTPLHYAMCRCGQLHSHRHGVSESSWWGQGSGVAGLKPHPQRQDHGLGIWPVKTWNSGGWGKWFVEQTFSNAAHQASKRTGSPPDTSALLPGLAKALLPVGSRQKLLEGQRLQNPKGDPDQRSPG